MTSWLHICMLYTFVRLIARLRARRVRTSSLRPFVVVPLRDMCVSTDHLESDDVCAPEMRAENNSYIDLEDRRGGGERLRAHEVINKC